MERKKQLEKAFQRGSLLNLKNPIYKNWIKKFIVEETRGDVGVEGDITTNALFKTDRATGVVKSRESGVLAGVDEVSYFLKKNGIYSRRYKRDGDRIKPGNVIMTIHGALRDILKTERSCLDIIQRMSGIATLTAQLKKKVGKSTAIAPTRKTQWRYLDKKAVFLGGGLTHRLALWDAILIKDNHLKALENNGIKEPIEFALSKSIKQKKGQFIEIEVARKKDAIKAAELLNSLNDKRPMLIMLDNMNPEIIKKTLAELKKKKLYDNILFEASGGIVPSSIENYADTGVDVISLGYLTNSARVLDIKLQIL